MIEFTDRNGTHYKVLDTAVVTDEMVDRALAAFFKPFYKDNVGDKVAMKIALVAALTN